MEVDNMTQPLAGGTPSIVAMYTMESGGSWVPDDASCGGRTCVASGDLARSSFLPQDVQGSSDWFFFIPLLTGRESATAAFWSLDWREERTGDSAEFGLRFPQLACQTEADAELVWGAGDGAGTSCARAVVGLCLAGDEFRGRQVSCLETDADILAFAEEGSARRLFELTACFPAQLAAPGDDRRGCARRATPRLLRLLQNESCPRAHESGSHLFAELANLGLGYPREQKRQRLADGRLWSAHYILRQFFQTTDHQTQPASITELIVILGLVSLAAGVCVLGNAVSVAALRRAAAKGRPAYVHQFSLIAADLICAACGWLFVVVEVVDEWIGLQYHPVVCQNFILTWLYVNRATPIQTALLANAGICIGISMDRIHAITGLLEYTNTRHMRRLFGMNAISYTCAALVAFSLIPSSVILVSQKANGNGSTTDPTSNDTLCCQFLFEDLDHSHISVIWSSTEIFYDVIKLDSGPVDCVWMGTRHGMEAEEPTAVRRIAAVALQLLLYGFLGGVNSSLAFIYSYSGTFVSIVQQSEARTDRRRVSRQAQGSGGSGGGSGGKGPVDERVMTMILLLSVLLHMLIGVLNCLGLLVISVTNLRSYAWPLGLRLSDVSGAVDGMAQLLTAFTVVSTFSFFAIISRSFRHHFLIILRLRKE